MVHVCGDYKKGFWLIEDIKSQMKKCLMLVDSAEWSLVDRGFEVLHDRNVHACGYSRKRFQWNEE